MSNFVWKVGVKGVGLWLPGFPNTQAWLTGQLNPEMPRPKPAVLDRQCARRASAFAKILALSYGEATEQAQTSQTDVSLIFGSSLGETSIMLRLLSQIVTEDSDFSPMLFAVSVHNAASGLVSISTKNRAFTTSVAADYDTPAMGLLEAAAASWKFKSPAVLVCGDEAAPKGLVPEEQAFDDLAAALVLDTNLENGGPYIAELEGLQQDTEGDIFADLPPPLARNPQAGILDLADAILRRRNGRVRLDRGAGHGWSVHVRTQ